jgi:polysaccharide chain length determinant protein (PEP-CTERM system associated)
MMTTVQMVFDEIRSAWRFRWFGITAALLLAVVGWTIVFALPDRYETTAKIFVDTRTALKPALKNLAMEQDVDAQINYVRQALLTGPPLEKLALDTGVITPNVAGRARVKALDDLADRITVTVTSAGTQGQDLNAAGAIYTVEYLDTNSLRSFKVVDTLLNAFVEQTLGGKREGSQRVQKFLEERMRDYERRLTTAEDRIAAFKQQNLGLMPTEQGGYFAQLQSEIDASKAADSKLSLALSRRDELTRQLHGDLAVSAAGSAAPAIAGPGAGAGSDTLSRIQEAQAKLDELLLKYTDKHPDVISARETLVELQQRRAKELASLRRGDAAAVATSGAGNNPVYQSIQLELNKVDVDIASLQRESQQHANAVAELRKHANTAPQVEAEYQQLTRDYAVNKAEYTALLESYQKAHLGEQADTAGSVRFEVILPPAEAAAPVWPKRTRLLAGIWLAALGVGAGVAYGLHVLRPVVISEAAMKEITRFPVLGVVTVAFPRHDRSVRRRRAWLFSSAAVALVALFAGAMVLNWLGIRIDPRLVPWWIFPSWIVS